MLAELSPLDCRHPPSWGPYFEYTPNTRSIDRVSPPSSPSSDMSSDRSSLPCWTLPPAPPGRRPPVFRLGGGGFLGIETVTLSDAPSSALTPSIFSCLASRVDWMIRYTAPPTARRPSTIRT